MTELAAGSIVHVRGEAWRLTHVEPFDACRVLTLEGCGAGNTASRLRLIDPFDRPVAAGAKRWQRHARTVVLRAAFAAVAESRPALGLWCAADASIDLHAYQLEPALAVLRGAARLLLADAVGLGKTIQAGLVLAELRARGWIERALIVCPAGLRAGWAAELRGRFGIECAVFDQAAIAEDVASLPQGVNPWSRHGVAIASMDFVKRPEVLAAASAVPFDLLIADEAHHLTPGTDRGAAIGRLAARTPWCILVSATPHSGDQAAFAYLTGLGAHGDAIAVFRRSRDEAGLSGSRRRQVLAVRPSGEDAALLGAVERYARAIWKSRGRIDRGAQILAITMARRAASTPIAIERTLVRRLALLGTAPDAVQSRLPWDEEDDADCAADGLLAAPGLDNEGDERAAIEQLITLSHRCGHGAKIGRLVRLLDRVREPVIVFTEYRDTVEAVVAALPAASRTACLHGAMSAGDRRSAIDAFNHGRADVLVATDAAGEGLNLHHRCRLVVDMELPWNPLRLEQRVGRVDRLGQQRRVHAISLFHPGGIEERVLRHLRIRQRRAAAAAAPVTVTEADVARGVFDGTAPDATTLQPMRTRSIDTAGSEADRLHRARRARRLGCRRLDHPSWARPRVRHRPLLVALRRITRINPHGTIVDEGVEAWIVEMTRPHDRRGWCALPRSVEERLPPPLVEPAAGPDQVVRRIASIRSHVSGDRTRELQRSLFDRRTDLVAQQEDETAARFLASLARREAVLDRTVAAGVLHTSLVAIWPLHSR